MISCNSLFNRIDEPFGNRMYTSFTTLVECGDRYALVKQAFVLVLFAVSLLVVFFPAFSVILMMPNVVKARRVSREHVLSS